MNKKQISFITLSMIIAMIIATGCVFNANRVTTLKSSTISSTNLTTVRIAAEDISGDIAINSSASPIIRSTLTVSEIALDNQATSASDQLTIGIDTLDQVGEVAFSYPENDARWELVRIESMVFDVDSTLAVSATITNGSITVSGAHDSLRLTTTNGSIAAEVQNKFNGTTTNGSIRLTIDADSLLADIRAETTNGAITISVPHGAKAILDLKTTNGSIICPGNNNSSLNSGGTYTIYCRTTNGSIEIEER